MMLDEHVIELFDRYITRQTSPEEERELMELFTFGFNDGEIEWLIDRCFDLVPVEHGLPREKADAIYRNITRKERHLRHRRAIAVAAGIALLAAIGSLLFLPRDNASLEAPVVLVSANDILPGSKRAILTLSDGSQLPLDTAREGHLAREGEISVVHRDKVLRYEGEPEEGDVATRYHLLSTPRGAYYETSLPDGSRAWLNAASSIRYPVTFASDERRVEVTGEVYFEVMAGAPFIVSAGGRAGIEVLGTHFNVNGYEDEGEIAVTLLEGAVRFFSFSGEMRESVRVRPGEQARLDAGGKIRVATVDTREVMAWKEGRFAFDRANIRSIMRQLVRWYDVEVEYHGEVTSHFGGTISRDVNISRVLRVLEQTGSVRFDVEENKVIVMPVKGFR
ncbi:MAG: DUF4974 domain-containing protein [Odoribacteraceae bacterium]|jgi:ferric-dicitrate binding protein FerR (iron transport regulator)|nr:DUF4974 domain-containing protein [Odoribacteraceae bacterium]